MSGVKFMFRSLVPAAVFAASSLAFSTAAQAVTVFDFAWEGQVAGFAAQGTFSYDETVVPMDGVVRRDDLLSFDVSFFTPLGDLMRTYVDNHLNYSGFNFNFDTASQTILQTGAYNTDTGLDIGEWTPTGPQSATGINLWSAPNHLHFDDWADEFGFPIGFHHHEDVAFFLHPTQALVDSGGVGDSYIGNTNFPLDAVGAQVAIVAPVPLPPALALLAAALGLFGFMSRSKTRQQSALAAC